MEKIRKNKNWYKIALNKNLGFYIYSQKNNLPIYKIINLVSRVLIYEGKSRYKALKIVGNFKSN